MDRLQHTKCGAKTGAETSSGGVLSTYLEFMKIELILNTSKSNLSLFC